MFSAFRHFGGQRAQQDRGRGIATSLKAQSKSVEAGGGGGGGGGGEKELTTSAEDSRKLLLNMAFIISQPAIKSTLCAATCPSSTSKITSVRTTTNTQSH